MPITAIMEYFPSLRTKRAYIVIVTCAVCYLVSLPFTCPVSFSARWQLVTVTLFFPCRAVSTCSMCFKNTRPMSHWWWSVSSKWWLSDIFMVGWSRECLFSWRLLLDTIISGFNRFMDDVKMMLGYRAAEYYLFVTWLVTAPILTLVSCQMF